MQSVSSHWPSVSILPHCSAPFSRPSLSSGLPLTQWVYFTSSLPFHVQPIPGIVWLGFCDNPIQLATVVLVDMMYEDTHVCSVSSSTSPSAPCQSMHRWLAVVQSVVLGQYTQQWRPHMNIIGVPPQVS